MIPTCLKQYFENNEVKVCHKLRGCEKRCKIRCNFKHQVKIIDCKNLENFDFMLAVYSPFVIICDNTDKNSMHTSGSIL